MDVGHLIMPMYMQHTNFGGGGGGGVGGRFPLLALSRVYSWHYVGKTLMYLQGMHNQYFGSMIKKLHVFGLASPLKPRHKLSHQQHFLKARPLVIQAETCSSDATVPSRLTVLK